MLRMFKIVTAVLVSSIALTAPAQAFTLGGVTRTPSKSIDALFIREKRRSVEPFAHVMFCVKAPGQCQNSEGPQSVELTTERKRELMAVNRRINSQINAVNDVGNDTWELAPASGDCEDFAITKRHTLIQKGWPAAALRLAVAQTNWGEGHLVLVVRTDKGDLVLDNMTNAVRNWRKAGLSWHMIQSAGNPRIWHRI